jgi:hypothetical protein
MLLMPKRGVNASEHPFYCVKSSVRKTMVRIFPCSLSDSWLKLSSDFVKILSAMRNGELNSEQISKLEGLSRPLRYSDGIEPSELCVFPIHNDSSIYLVLDTRSESKLRPAIAGDFVNLTEISFIIELWTKVVTM